jgi:hypothetical protein
MLSLEKVKVLENRKRAFENKVIKRLVSFACIIARLFEKRRSFISPRNLKLTGPGYL